MTSAETRRPNAWWVAVVAGMASYIDAAAIVSSGIAFVIYQGAIGLAPDAIGLLSAALTLSIAVGALFGGRLGDRFGRRSVFIVTMVLIAIGAGFLVFSTAVPLLLVGTIFVGVGSGADLPVSLATISEAADDHNRGRLIGFSQIMWFVGIAAAILLSIVVGAWGYIGGQVMFGHIGVVAVIVLALRLTIPESATWKAARAEREGGERTVRAQRAGLKDLFANRIYLVPLLALLGFYTLTNLAANTTGQFGTYINVNLAGLDIPTSSSISLLGIPLGIAFAFWFMRISDGRRRMPYFVVGIAAFIASQLVYVVFGFNIGTIIAATVLGAFGSAFAFEAIMKLWTQESFPTLLRSTAQGAIIAIARVAAAGLALFTPALLGNPRLMFLLIALVVAVGGLIGWLGFRKGRFNTFDIEDEEISSARAKLREAGLLGEAPGHTPAQGTPTVKG
jgi:inositol transporter-like SP family MFS transporter